MAARNAKFVVFTGSNFDLEFGNASTNRAVEIALSFKHLGHSPYLISLKPEFTNSEGSKERVFRSVSGTYMGDPFRALKRGAPTLYGMLNHRIGIILNTVKFFLWLRANKARVAHVFALSSSPLSLLIQAVACRMLRIPSNYDFVEEDFSITLHGDFSIIKRILWFYQLLPLILLKYLVVMRLFDSVTCITPSLKRLVLNLGIPEWRAMVFPILKFIEDDPPPSCSGDLKRPAHIVYMGHLSLTKDALDSLIAAFGILKRRGRDAKLKIYGHGTPRTFSRLRETIAKYDVEDCVELCGFVPREELVQAVRDAYVCALLKRNVPSNRYNFPTRLVDYMYHKKAVIMSPLRLHLDYFSHKESCLFVDTGQVAGIADAIEWALDHPKQIDEIGENAFQVLRRRLDGVALVTAYLDHLGNLPLKKNKYLHHGSPGYLN